jgi:hypothetical protein
VTWRRASLATTQRCGRASERQDSTEWGRRPYWRYRASIFSPATAPTTGGGRRGRRRRGHARLGRWSLATNSGSPLRHSLHYIYT